MKRLTLILTCAVVMLAAAALMLLRRPEPLALPDGSSVRVLTVTYGTSHVIASPLARFVGRLPASAQARLARWLGKRAQPRATIRTPTPTLVVWLERKAVSPSSPPGQIKALLADSHNFTSGDEVPLTMGSALEPLRFRAFPRRDPGFALQFFYHSPDGTILRCGRLSIANPRRGTFPQWKPEALPASQRAGDVEATLEQLSTGHDWQVGWVDLPGGGRARALGTNRLDGRNWTLCLLRLRPLGQTNILWQVVNVELSDATGNRLSHPSSMNSGGLGQDLFSFEPGLWPGEAAWKLKCELKRGQGFASGETFTFQRVPLEALSSTNQLHWTTNLGGATVTLSQVARRQDILDYTFTVTGLTNGMYLDLPWARTDTGTNLDGFVSGSATERSYEFRNVPAEAKSADLTFAVQRGRWVEFTVKPEFGPGLLEGLPAGRR